MHKFFILSASFLFFLLSSKSTKAENYIEYNLEILNAQHFLINNNLDSAFISYKSAFNMVTKPFPKDYRNAALTAYYIDSIALMKEYLEKAVINGYHCEITFKHQIKKSFNFFFKKDKIFLKYLEDKCDELIKIDFQNPVYSKYKGFFDMDQKARKGQNKKNKEINMRNSDKLIYAELIKDGINESFYPGYITAGAYSYVDLSYVFMMHITLDNYENIIINALTNGEITPYEAGNIYARQFSFHNNGSCPTKFPDLITNTNRRYEGERYLKLKKMGFLFDRFI